MTKERLLLVFVKLTVSLFRSFFSWLNYEDPVTARRYINLSALIKENRLLEFTVFFNFFLLNFSTTFLLFSYTEVNFMSSYNWDDYTYFFLREVAEIGQDRKVSKTIYYG